jgi:hypothetical protein
VGSAPGAGAPASVLTLLVCLGALTIACLAALGWFLGPTAGGLAAWMMD